MEVKVRTWTRRPGCRGGTASRSLAGPSSSPTRPGSTGSMAGRDQTQRQAQWLVRQGGVPDSARAVAPFSASATVHEVRHYMLLLTAIDPDTLTPRNVAVCWNEREWTVASQSVEI